MSTPLFNFKTISYICPECRKRVKVQLTYVEDNIKAKLEKSIWCLCGATHNLIYKIYKKRKTDEVKIKVLSFLFNKQEILGKRFKEEEKQIKYYTYRGVRYQM